MSSLCNLLGVYQLIGNWHQFVRRFNSRWLFSWSYRIWSMEIEMAWGIKLGKLIRIVGENDNVDDDGQKKKETKRNGKEMKGTQSIHRSKGWNEREEKTHRFNGKKSRNEFSFAHHTNSWSSLTGIQTQRQQQQQKALFGQTYTCQSMLRPE